MLKVTSVIAIIITTILASSPVFAENNPSKQEDGSFLPAWRLLNTENKQQFVSGYQRGWKDAVNIIDIVITYLKTNPSEGIKALESVRNIYDLENLRPDDLVKAIDKYYADPDNNNAPFSKAITAAKNRTPRQ